MNFRFQMLAKSRRYLLQYYDLGQWAFSVISILNHYRGYYLITLSSALDKDLNSCYHCVLNLDRNFQLYDALVVSLFDLQTKDSFNENLCSMTPQIFYHTNSS